MPGVHIVTDSSSDLRPDEIDPDTTQVIPLSIRFGEDEYTDGQDLSVDEFYVRMATSDELPQTACPSPGAFDAAFARAEEAGAESVVCVTISGKLSNTLQSAKTAADAFSGSIPVHVIDSLSVSSGLGTVALEAAQAAEQGADTGSVLRRVADLIPRTHVFAALNTLENLRKGGRVGGAMAMVGSLLSIKPVIDISGGEVAEAGKPRTRTRALHLLYQRMLDAGRIGHIAVMHGNAPDIEEFLDLIAPHFPRTSLRIGRLGAVIGAHGGAGIIGTSWVTSP